MARKKVTSSDVAEKAGVSQATVSMVLNHKYNVSFSRETVEKVESAARELGYQLPGHKNKKENKKEKMIVVFCPTITSPYYVMLLQGIEAVANERGYGVFICNTQRDAHDTRHGTPGDHLCLQSPPGLYQPGRRDGKKHSAGHH